MPTYRNDTPSPVCITDLSGFQVTVPPGGTVSTYELREDLTMMAGAPYWCPTVKTDMPGGDGDLGQIAIDPDCHEIEVWNHSGAVVRIKLRSADASEWVLPPRTVRRLCGPYGLHLASVADTLLLSVSAPVSSGQVVIAQIRAGAE